MNLLVESYAGRAMNLEIWVFQPANRIRHFPKIPFIELGRGSVKDENGKTRAAPATRWRSSVRVSAWSRGQRSRPACGHSVSGGQSNDDENRVVLLAAAVHDGHGRPWTHRKTRGPNVRGR